MFSFFALLLFFAKSLSLFEAKKVFFSPSQTKYKSTIYDNYTDIIDIKVDTNSKKNQKMVIGYNGTFVFTTEYKDNSTDIFDPKTIEKETKFTTFMVDKKKINHNITCRFWKPEDIIIILCDANFNTKGNHSVRLGNVSFVHRGEYLINVNFYGKKEFTFEQNGLRLSFIYSDKQNINIYDNQSSYDLYELKFKFNTYYNERLYIYGTKTEDNYLFLDNCNKKGKELICTISKQMIEETLIFKKEEFGLMFMNNTSGKNYCRNVYPITINYRDVKKVNIYIELKKVVGCITEALTPIAFETNVTKIPNLITNRTNLFKDSLYSYFKKTTSRNLMLITQYNLQNKIITIPSSKKEIILNNIHYKYNFRIKPFQFNGKIEIKNKGAKVNLVYPEKIDFTSSSSAIIRFSMNTPSLDTGIKLNQKSDSYLECKDLSTIKECVVPISHFNGRKSGYFNVYHKNHAGSSITYYALPLIHVTLPEENTTKLYIEEKDNRMDKYIGYQGILNFVLDYNDSAKNIFKASDIEEKSTFKTTITIFDDKKKEIEVKCKLWKPIGEKLNMFCKLNVNFTNGRHSFNLTSSFFYYNCKKYVIIQPKSLSLFQVNKKLPFLYSSKQVLNIKGNSQPYYLKFKIGEYNKESLMMRGEGIGAYIFLDKCSVKGKELSCEIDRQVIEEYTSYNGQNYSIFYNFPHSEKAILEMDKYIYSIYGIYINYQLSKIDINVNIDKLLVTNIDQGNFIAYETNVKDINNVHTATFKLALSNGKDTDCFIKKAKGISLAKMICMIDNEGEFSLGKTKNQIKLNNINIKYNFIIQPINNNEKFTVSGKGGYMMYALPKDLDFTSKATITIDFAMNHPENIRGIRFNNETNDLECTNINSNYKRCKIHKSHFRNKPNGYYYTRHANHNNNSIKFYESSPLHITLPQTDIYISIKKVNNKNKIKLNIKDAVFVIVTDYNNKERNKFNNNDAISFQGTFICKSNSETYKANCKLWILSDENSKIICKHDGYFDYPDIYLKYTEIKYKTQNIFIEQNELIEFELSDDDYAPFLFSDKQTININDKKEVYELKFKIEVYNKEPLYIYGSNNNYANLDNCPYDTKEITCKISKKKLEEILVKNNEHFKIGAINDTLGIFSFEYILDITINYENVQKKDVYLEIKEIIGDTTEIGIPVGLVTNVTDIPNFISATFDDMKYFKKVTGRPLILFYNFSYEIDYIMGSNYTQEVVKDNIHYKYTFRIQPSTFEGHISVKENGANILLAYPQELNFNSHEKLTIRFIMNDPTLAENIKLNQDHWIELYCKDLNKMKKCDVPKSHFDGKHFGNYYASRSNHNHRPAIYYDSSPINIIKPLEINIIGNTYDIYIGNKGMLYLETDYNDTELNVFNDSNIEENTKFNMSFSYGDKNYSNIPCHLWKNGENIIYIFCKLNETLSNDNRKIKFDMVKFIYNKLVINITQKFNISFIQLEKPIPFLYSKSQTINIEEGKDIYYLKFNAENYQNEKFIIRVEGPRQILLDECSMEQKELICKLYKSDIEENYFRYLYESNFKIYYPYLNGPLIPSHMVGTISVKYNMEKIDVKITIGKLLQKYVDKYNTFAYEVETNVTNISNLVTEFFPLNFEFFKETTETIVEDCFFKKANDNPLYLVCVSRGENISISLSEINNVIELTNIHGKYNFYIQPVINKDTITTNENGNFLTMIIPKTLDYYINDPILIDIIVANPNYNRGIRLDINASEDLACEDLDSIKRCSVPKSHFGNGKSGYYNTYHLNHMNEYIRYYEYSPIQVIMPKDNEIIIKIKDYKTTRKIGQKGFISFVTNFRDSNNVFNESDIETLTANKITFSSINKNYKADCRLWKLKSEEVKLFCKFEENIDAQRIKLNKFSFTYKDKIIYLVCEDYFDINQSNSNISFLYSDKQEINITENITDYNITFKKEIYNKEHLILYNDDNHNMRSVYLNCSEVSEEIKCSASKDKLVKILSKDGDEFYLSQLTKSEGILKFENVMGIEIYYSNVVKKDIYLNITKLLTQTVEKNSYIVFETNITDVQTLTTGTFKIPLNSKTNMELECLFKKTNNLTDDKLLLLCNADSEGEYQLDIKETNLDNIHILYSFKIPAIVTEKVNVTKNEGTKILSVYPESLNFTNISQLMITYQCENPEKLKNIKLSDYYYSDLYCEIKNNIKECTVPESYFKETGYYYTFYKNSLGNKVISYEIPKILITLKKKEDEGKTDKDNKDNSGSETPKSNKNLVGIIVGSVVGGLALIAAIVVIIIFVKKRKRSSIEINGLNNGSSLLPNSNQVELVEGEKF